jgi:hypothetical protein
VVLYHLIVFRFCARRAQKRKTEKLEAVGDARVERFERGRIEEAFGRAGGADLIAGEGDCTLERLIGGAAGGVVVDERRK